MSRPRVFVITDSLGLPRQEPDFVPLDLTWPQLLRSALPGVCVHQLSLGNATTEEMVPQTIFLKGQEPALAIVQVGIVDCAPRAFSRGELALLLATRVGRALLARLESKVFRYLRRVRSVSYVPPERFVSNTEKMAVVFGCPTIWIGILGRSDYDQQVPGIRARIAKYNGLIRDRWGADFLDLEGRIGDEHIMADGHHLNVSGHHVLLQALMSHASFRSFESTVGSGRIDG